METNRVAKKKIPKAYDAVQQGLVTPVKQTPPKIKFSDYVAMLPVAFCSAAAHSSSVLALNAGSVTFGQIVKAGEPVFSALVNTIVYGKSPSIAKWCCLPVVIGGVVFSCLKPTPAGSYAPDPHASLSLRLSLR